MAAKGDKLTDFVTSGWYNDVTKKTKANLGGRPKSELDQNQYVTVYNHEAVHHKPWEAVSLGDAIVDYDTAIDGRFSEIGFHTKALDGTDPHNLAILQEPLAPIVGASALALVSGSSWLRMPVEMTPLFGEPVVTEAPWLIRINADDDTLEYATEGRIESIRDFILGGGEYLAVAIIGKLASTGGGDTIEFKIVSGPTVAGEGEFVGLKVCSVKIKGILCGKSSEIETTVDVYDHSGCIFDESDMENYTGWAFKAEYYSLDPYDPENTVTSCHWAAFNRCCAPNSGTYYEPPVTSS